MESAEKAQDFMTVQKIKSQLYEFTVCGKQLGNRLTFAFKNTVIKDGNTQLSPLSSLSGLKNTGSFLQNSPAMRSGGN